MKLSHIISEQYITGRERVERGEGYVQYQNHDGTYNYEAIGTQCTRCGGSGRNKAQASIATGKTSKSPNKSLGGSKACPKCSGTGIEGELMYGTLSHNYNDRGAFYDGQKSFESMFPVMHRAIMSKKDKSETHAKAARELGTTNSVSIDVFKKLSNSMGYVRVSRDGKTGEVKFNDGSSKTDMHTKNSDIGNDTIITHTSGEREQMKKNKDAMDKKNNRTNIPYNKIKKTKAELQSQDPEIYKFLYQTYTGGNKMIDSIKDKLDGAKGSISKGDYHKIHTSVNNYLNQ